MTERGDQSKEGRGGTCPLTGPVKPRDGAWWRGSAQVQRGGGCSLSGGVGISVRPVVGHTGLWMCKGQVCLFVTRAVQCCKCVWGKSNGKETLFIIRWQDGRESNASLCDYQCGNCLPLTCPTWLPLATDSSACFVRVSATYISTRVKHN